MPSEESRLTYIVDIDNTILDTQGSDYENARPILSRIARINDLFNEGHTIIYWTARGGRSGIDWSYFTVKQLFEYGAKYTELRMNKPSYDIWIDDKAFNSEDYFN
jgi:hypothetical protein